MRSSAILQLLIAASVAVLSAQSPDTFTATGSMITPRFGHTATLLPNGKVLIAGGFTVCFLQPQPCIGPNSAELYDPSTGTFTATGIMNTIRPIGGFLLADGKVLFAEGYSVTGGFASVELYDPSTATFKRAGNAATLESSFSAALLNDGRVLLIGRTNTGGGAEIYEPTAETFSPVSNWPTDVASTSTLALLPDGRILLDYPGLYDPIAGTLTKFPIWPLNDTPPAALLPGGQVLITGGSTDGGSVNWAELFNPAGGTFPATGSMSSVRDGHTANLLPDGTALVVGGATTFDSTTKLTLVTASAELYSPVSGSFSRLDG